MSKYAYLALACFCFLAAAMLLWARPSVVGHLELLQSAPVLNARSIRMLGHGEGFRLSAVIAASNDRAYRDLVVYDIEEWSDGTGRSGGSWHTAFAHRPPVLVTGHDGDTLTLHGAYFLLDGRQYAAGNSKRYRGLVAGDSVGIYGTMSRTSAGLRVLGESVILGTAATLTYNQEHGLRLLDWIWGVLLAAGLVCLALQVRRGRRIARAGTGREDASVLSRPPPL